MTKASLALEHRATSGAFETNFGCERTLESVWGSAVCKNGEPTMVTLIHRGNPTIVNVTSAGFYFIVLGSSLIQIRGRSQVHDQVAKW